jgi:hypothetical protein
MRSARGKGKSSLLSVKKVNLIYFYFNRRYKLLLRLLDTDHTFHLKTNYSYSRQYSNQCGRTDWNST